LMLCKLSRILFVRQKSGGGENLKGNLRFRAKSERGSLNLAPVWFLYFQWP
jgi:hypothetical protein